MDLGSSKRKRGLDRPLQPFPHLIVLDFEWTCDNRKPMKPHSEITEFSCVLVQTTHRPASIVSEFQQYVKPEHNPNLSQFAIELTGIENNGGLAMLFEDCEITECRTIGINARNGVLSTMRRCVVHHNGTSGIYFSGQCTIGRLMDCKSYATLSTSNRIRF